jgi:hypothetical protein
VEMHDRDRELRERERERERDRDRGMGMRKDKMPKNERTYIFSLMASKLAIMCKLVSICVVGF